MVTEALRLKEKQVANKLVRSEGNAHIVRLNKIIMPKVATKKADPEAFSASAMESLNRWAKELREAARVSVNTAVLDR